MRGLVLVAMVASCGDAPRPPESAPPSSVAPAVTEATSPSDPASKPGPTPSRDPSDWPLACKRLAADALPLPGTEAEAAKNLASSHALLGISDPCDEAAWVEMQRATPNDEALYCVLTMMHHDCHESVDAISWAERRVAAFPKSSDAHRTTVMLILGLVILPDGRGIPNETLPPAERIAWLDRALELLEAAHRVGLETREYHLFASMALTQRSWAHVVVEEPRSEIQELAFLEARNDVYRAWEHQRAICDAAGLRTCTAKETGEGCCPDRPLSAAEHRADEKRRRVLERSVAR